MSMILEDKVAVVTGGSQGIGRGICERFLAAGATVVIADMKAPADIDEWRKTVDNKVSWVSTNVTQTKSIQALATSIENGFGHLDVLVNNAGIMFERSIDEQTENDWDLMMSVNVKGPIMVTKYLLPMLRRGVEKAAFGYYCEYRIY